LNTGHREGLDSKRWKTTMVCLVKGENREVKGRKKWKLKKI